MRRKLLLSLIPFILGLALRLVLANDWLENPIVFLRADLGTLALLSGMILAIGVGIGIWFQDQIVQRRDKAVAKAQKRAADDRRRFLQRLDHELKNPLTAIQAGLANLSGLQELDQQALESVKTQTQRLGQLVGDLRKISDLETRPIENNPVKLDIVLQVAVDLAQVQMEDNDRTVILTVPQAPWPLPVISGDEDLLFLALHNLIVNALKFTQPGDTIEVRVFEDGAMVVIEVADTGLGIPEDELPYVWDELYRGKAARSVPGSGLGLALVRTITERHGGQVGLRSRSGQGTVFTMRLPVGNVSDS